MSYHIYTTDAIVLEAYPRGEAGLYFLLFTRELGVIGASAEGIRLMKSKLRYALQAYSRAGLGVVRGKEAWRIVSAMPRAALSPETRRHTVRLLSLIARLSPGERSDRDLYDFLADALKRMPLVSPEHRFVLEILSGLNICSAFGYGPSDEALARFSGFPVITHETLKLFSPFVRLSEAHIKYAITASHL